MTILSRIKDIFLQISGYLIPLLQQIPTLGIYVGLMTLPLIAVLAVLFTQFPFNLIGGIAEFISMSFMSPGVFLANLVTLIGILLTVYSIIYFYRHKKIGLVTTGPYRFIRHPQYTGFLLITLGLTVFCYWWLSNTFGIGWLSKEATVALWFVQFGIYITLALIEEYSLTKEWGDAFRAYKYHTSFLIPVGRLNRFDIPLSISILSLAMIGLLLMQMI
ncbi:MAG: methyltransferase family protein [Promethearchaeota archaeon]